MVKIPQHKVTKWNIFLATLFPIVFVQSGSKTSTAAVYSKHYISMKEDLSIIFLYRAMNLVYFFMKL